jgi:hypothetical protein
MDLSGLQVLIGDLVNDPNHDRYSISQINLELDNIQDEWNVRAKIIKDTVTLTVVDGTRQYAMSSLTGRPISFTRATHKGLELQKKDKSFLDLYSGSDWTAELGTPKYYIIEATDPDNQYVTLFPTPGAGDAGAYLVVEYVKQHTSMTVDSDTPFMSGTTVQYLMRPYDFGIAYGVASKLLLRDPSQQNAAKSVTYQRISDGVLADVVQVFKALEKAEPMRLRGGRIF